MKVIHCRTICTRNFSLSSIWVSGFTWGWRACYQVPLSTELFSWPLNMSFKVLSLDQQPVSPKSLLELQILGPTSELLNYKHWTMSQECVLDKSFTWFWWHTPFENNGLGAFLICSPIMTGLLLVFNDPKTRTVCHPDFYPWLLIRTNL